MSNFLGVARAKMLILESAGKEMRVTFVKKDGTRRIMRCRLPRESDSKYVNKMSARPAADGVILVFCLDCFDKARVSGAGDIAAGGGSWRFVSLDTVEDVVVLF